MARPITLMAIFFLCMNLFSGVVMSTGVGAMIGVDTAVGGDDEVDRAVDSSGNVSAGAPTGSTLFGMYNVLADGLATISLPVTAGPQMLDRAGVPGVIANQLLQPVIAIVMALGVMSYLRGWGL